MADKLGKYYIGLDLGTDSVGWAVTDERYRLLRRKGKDLWGARLFSSAKTSQERRSNRTNRRRLQRRNSVLIIYKSLFVRKLKKSIQDSFSALRTANIFLRIRLLISRMHYLQIKAIPMLNFIRNIRPYIIYVLN